MKQFQYTITGSAGLQDRPAGLLVKAAKELDSTVTVGKAEGKPVSATNLMALIDSGIQQGDTITVTIEGGNEEANAQTLGQFFKENL